MVRDAPRSEARCVRAVGGNVFGGRLVLVGANDYYGMSQIEAAASAIDSHNQASKWNKALLDNSARPSGALVYASREGQLTEGVRRIEVLAGDSTIAGRRLCSRKCPDRATKPRGMKDLALASEL